MEDERKSFAEYGLKIEKPYRRNRLKDDEVLRILLLFLTVSVCALFVQQYIYHDAAEQYDVAVSAVLLSLEQSMLDDDAAQDAMEAPVNVNTADVQELCRLPGIGEAKAGAIIDYRINNGPFTYKEELMKVSGIGEKLYAKIAPQVILADEEPATE